MPNVVALIPARGGSKSVLKKNIRILGGKPLLAWSIDTAREVDAIDRIIVSTDSDDIADVAAQHGAEVSRRPEALASDDALVVDTIRYHIGEWRGAGCPADIVVLLEPTSPLRTPDDVRRCVDVLNGAQRDSVATFTEAELNPHRAWRLDGEFGPQPFIEGAVPWLPRQSLPEAYQLNGAVYAFWADRLPEDTVAPLFGQMAAVLMPAERSVDIDSSLDFIFAETLINRSFNGQ